jgi:putative SOS response-associated peptidase YedK
MCGRFTVTAHPELLAEEFFLDEIPLDFKPRYNMAPGQNIPLIRRNDAARDESRRLEFFRWGLVPSWAKDANAGRPMINARSETVAEKPTFRAAFKKRRCLIIADGFYEWKRSGSQKVPNYIRLKEQRPFAFAGLWECWKAKDQTALYSCTILTVPPNALVADIHDRMPVILPQQHRETWLSPKSDSAALHALLRPYAANEMEAYPVSKRVNSTSTDDARCTERVASQETLSLF